jgi:hypothetical protein
MLITTKLVSTDLWYHPSISNTQIFNKKKNLLSGSKDQNIFFFLQSLFNTSYDI